MDEATAVLQAVVAIRQLNSMGTPVVVPPKLLERVRQHPEIAALIDQGAIIPNLPIKVSSNA